MYDDIYIIGAVHSRLLTILFPVSGPTPLKPSKEAAAPKSETARVDWLTGAKALAPAIALINKTAFIMVNKLTSYGIVSAIVVGCGRCPVVIDAGSRAPETQRNLDFHFFCFVLKPPRHSVLG
jgi:hypothetical protein